MEAIGVKVTKSTNTDLSIVESSKINLVSLSSELIELAELAKEHSHQISEITQKIHSLTNEGVIAIQFEDIVNQMMERVINRAQAISHFLHGFVSLHQDRDEVVGSERFNKRIQGLKKLLAESPDIIQNQTGMTETELF
jgi:methyl-accepting chemotaxis protein